MVDVSAAIHRVEIRGERPVWHNGRLITTVHLRELLVATGEGDWDALPVIGADGKAGIALRQRAVYPEGIGLWGCATCEQWHPTDVATCPLVGHATHDVRVGPIYHDGGQVLYLSAVEAVFDVTPSGVGGTDD